MRAITTIGLDIAKSVFQDNGVDAGGQGHQASILTHGVVGAAADQGRCHRACQQDRADGLSDDGQRQAPQGTHRARSVIDGLSINDGGGRRSNASGFDLYLACCC
jgi:hypothetical protein